MENFFNYITKPLNYDEVDIWFRSHNIVNEKLELFFDFSYSLTLIIVDTYLGGDLEKNESLVDMSDKDTLNHFNWCWKKNIENFQKEGLIINEEGEHYEYFKDFFSEIFYKHKEEKVRKSIGDFFIQMFDRKTPFTKSDLDVILTIYRSIDTNMVIIY